jgi:endonuclease/exonuclease/phosphatase family metal-dependent hydrolase
VTALFLIFNLARLSGYATERLLDADEIHTIMGEPTRMGRLPAPNRPLTVVTWNIAQGAQYEQVRETLAAMDADMYLLQEVDMGVRRSAYRQVARDLAHDLGMNWVFGGEFQEIGQSRRNTAALTGQAVLSRYPIYNAYALPFENQARLRWRLDPLQPRRGGRMALRAESGGVLLYNAHIESAKDDRFRHKQVHEMVVDQLEPGRASLPVVFAGDFNTELLPDRSPVVSCLTDEGFVDALGAMTALRQTSVHHDQPLDWIFIRNRVAAVAGRVIDAAKASDHFPLAATISVGSPIRYTGD